MIAIIGAMAMEVDGLVEKLENKKAHMIGKISFTTGKIDNKDVVIARCGEGKVNSSVVATTLMNNVKDIDIVLSIGVAGGVKPDIKQGDIVVAKQSVQHDYDLTPVGLEKGFVAGVDKMYFVSDENAVNVMASAIESLGYKYECGTIASGDQFVSDKELSGALYGIYGAFAVDMETASIAHACDLYGKKFVGMRAMSDNADGTGAEDFMHFATKASQKSINVIIEFIKQY